ncbi:uncharacterized protein LOC144099362 isoform X2 [Amblyomma americanum]
MSDATGRSASSAAAAERAARAEAQRRRRQNPEVRASEAEAKRRRREDPRLRAAEAEAYRRRRRQDPAVRAAEAKAKRRRRADPAVRAAEAEARRKARLAKHPQAHRSRNKVAVPETSCSSEVLSSEEVSSEVSKQALTCGCNCDTQKTMVGAQTKDWLSVKNVTGSQTAVVELSVRVKCVGCTRTMAVKHYLPEKGSASTQTMPILCMASSLLCSTIKEAATAFTSPEQFCPNSPDNDHAAKGANVRMQLRYPEDYGWHSDRTLTFCEECGWHSDCRGCTDCSCEV